MSSNNISAIISIALSIGVVIVTVSKANIFAPFRHWLEYRAKLYWLSDMIGCPYCFSHWVAALAQSWFQFTFTQTWWPVDLVIGWLSFVALGNLVGIAIYTGWAVMKAREDA